MKKFGLTLLLLLTSNIYPETINGHTLPPEPDHKINILSSEIFGKDRVRMKDGRTSIAYIAYEPQRIWKTPYGESNYISNIKAKVATEDVLNVSFGKPSAYKTSGIRFNFIDFLPYNEEIEYIITDNHGYTARKKSKIIRNIKQEKQNSTVMNKNILSSEINSKVWNTTQINEVVKLLYGSNALKKFHQTQDINYISLTCKNKSLDILDDGLWHEEQCLESLNTFIAIKIHSSKELESIALLYTGNIFPLLFVSKFSKFQTLPLKFRMRLYGSGTLILLAQDKYGEFYYSKFYETDTRTANGLDDGTRLDFHIK